MRSNRCESLLYRPKGPAKLGRRAMLRGAGGVLVGLPFLQGLEGRARAAQESPRRLITFFSPNGFEISGRPVSEDLAGTSLEALQPFRSQITTISGMSHESVKLDTERGDGSHYINWAHCVVGDNAVPGSKSGRVAGAISYDQVAGEKISEDWQVKSLNQGGPSWRSRGVPAFGGAYNPKAVWESLFKGLSVGNDEEAEKLAAERRLEQRSILDFARKSVEALQCELGAEDRARLESHLEDLRALEQRIDAEPSGAVADGCAIPAQPVTVPWNEYKENTSAFHRGYHDLKVEMTVMAMACDVVRVGTIGLAGGAAGSEVPADVGVAENHHELSHKGGDSELADLRKIDRYSTEQFAHLLTRLDEVSVAGDKTLLDQSAVLWLSEGGISGGHGTDGLEYVVAGGAGERLKGGQHLAYQGFAHNNLLLELVNSVLPTDATPLECFGNAAVCDKGVPELRA